MLGNDLNGIHGTNQTLINLKFTLDHEKNFPLTDKIYVLNRIIDLNVKNKIINLLNDYGYKYIDIKFDFKYYKKFLYNKNFKIEITKYMNPLKKKTLLQYLYNYNLYIINNNECRNFCIDYGKKKNYIWTFVLDSNNFFNYDEYINIIRNIHINNDVLIILQKRLNDKHFTNNVLLKKNYKDYVKQLRIQEPQIAFKNTSNLYFNKFIPYGVGPKVELLNAIGVKGEWNNTNGFESKFNIKQRHFSNINFKVFSNIVRLIPHNIHNKKENNNNLRILGLINTINHIDNIILKNHQPI